MKTGEAFEQNKSIKKLLLRVLCVFLNSRREFMKMRGNSMIGLHTVLTGISFILKIIIV